MGDVTTCAPALSTLERELHVTPVALVGGPGCGKSTLLASWLHRRQERLSRQQVRSNEFCFVHVVGCTRQSVLVRELLTRLSSELMAHFKLPKPRNFDPDRLAWDLPRLLDAASSKGRVLIVIDGLHRLRNDKGEINLKWLPVAFPANVYFIVSTSTLGLNVEEAGPEARKGDDMALATDIRRSLDDNWGAAEQRKAYETVEAKIKKRMMFELERRRWQWLEMNPLAPTVRTSILDNFLKTYEVRPCRICTNGEAEFLSALSESMAMVLAGNESDSYAYEDADIQSTTWSNTPQNTCNRQHDTANQRLSLNLFEQHYRKLQKVRTNALALAAFLRSLGCSAARGFDLWELVDAWLEKASLTMPAASDDVAAPLFDAVLETWEVGYGANDSHRQRARQKALNAGPTMVMLATLRANKGHMERPTSEYSSILSSAFGGKSRYDWSNGSAKLVSQTLSRASLARKKTITKAAVQGRSSDMQLSAAHDEHDVSAIGPDTLRQPSTLAEEQHGATSKLDDETINVADVNKSSDSHPRDIDDENYGDDDFEEDYVEDFENSNKSTACVPIGNDGEAKVIALHRDFEAQRSSVDSTSGDHLAGMKGDSTLNETTALKFGKEKQHAAALGNASNHETEGAGVVHANTRLNACLEDVPDYFLGGSDTVPGLGKLLGDALAFLYVARYGLREDEMWSLLNELAADREREADNSQDVHADSARTAHPERSESSGLTDTVAAKSDRIDVASLASRPKAGREAKNEDDDLDDLVGMLSKNDEAAKKTSSIGSKSDMSKDVAAKQLPTLLRALGVIHNVDAGVFVLPLESEALRTVVKKRYIDGALKLTTDDEVVSRTQGSGSSENRTKLPASTSSSTGSFYDTKAGSDRWHARLAAFFARQSPSGRRAEELPWHLKHCRQWTSLCDTLANIPTFETMFHGSPQMRHELQEYWRLLSEGPLYLTRLAQHEATVLASEATANQKLLQALDAEYAQGKVELLARRHRLVNQSATFDVVDAYNKAIEAWYDSEKPTTHRLAEAMRAIAEFLFEFDERTDEPPFFLRSALNIPRLNDLGFVDIASKKATTNCSSIGAMPLSPTSVVSASTKRFSTSFMCSPAAGVTFDLANQSPSIADRDENGFVAGYQPPKSDGGAIESMNDLLTNVRGADSNPKAAPYSASQSSVSTVKLYCYQRWMWLQFPWLTLANAASVSWAIGRKYATAQAIQTDASVQIREAVDDATTESNASSAGQAETRLTLTGETNTNVTSLLLASVDLDTPPARRALAAAASAVVNCASGPKDRRFWEVKRRDPNAPPVVKVSDKRLRARVQARVRRSHVAAPSLEKLTLEASEATVTLPPPLEDTQRLETDADEALLSSIEKAPAAERHLLRLRRVATRQPPRRMRWHPTGAVTNDVKVDPGPFSASSVRSRARGTRFPSAEAHYVASVLKRSASCDAYGATAATRFGGTSELTKLRDLMALNELERLEAVPPTDTVVPAHSALFPLSHEERQLAKGRASVGKLRAALDKLVTERDQRRKMLETAENEVEARSKHDRHCSDQLRRGEATLTLLDDRVATVRAALAEAAALGAMCYAIANLTRESRPSAAASRLEVIKRQLELARVQASDLLAKRRELLKTSETARLNQLPRLCREKKKWTALMLVARRRRRVAAATLDALRAIAEDISHLALANPNENSAKSAFLTEPPPQPQQPPPSTNHSTPSGSKPQLQSNMAIDEIDQASAAVLARSASQTVNERLAETLALAAGASLDPIDPAEIAAKYWDLVQLNADLEARHCKSVSRLAQLRMVLEVTRAEFADIKLQGARDKESMDDHCTRRLESALFEAARHLRQKKSVVGGLFTIISCARTGLLHIDRLVSIYTSSVPSKQPTGAMDLLTQLDQRMTMIVEANPVSAKLGRAQPPPDSDASNRRKAQLDKIRQSYLPADEKCYQTLVNQIDPVELRQDPHVAPGVRIKTLSERDRNSELRLQSLEKLDADLDAAEKSIVPKPNEISFDAFINKGLDTPQAHRALRRANALSRLKQGAGAPLGLALGHAKSNVAQDSPLQLPRQHLLLSHVTDSARPVVPDRVFIKSTADATAAGVQTFLLGEQLGAEHQPLLASQ